MELLYKAAHCHALVVEIEQAPLLQLSGADVVRYLHGRITQDVKGLSEAGVARSLLLTPQGRILGHFYLAKPREIEPAASILIVSDPIAPEATEQFIKDLMQFKVADQVTATPLHSTHSLITIQGPESAKVVTTVCGQQALVKANTATRVDWEGSSLLVVNFSRTSSNEGFDIVVSKEKKQLLVDALLAAGGIAGDEATLDLLRIEAGRPRFGIDLNESVFGPEMGVSEVVSFTKGCYAGQEMVEMATARGRPNRKFILGELNTAKKTAETTNLLPGAEVLNFESGAKVGEVTSVAALPWAKKTLLIALIKTSALDASLKILDLPIAKLPEEVS